MSPDRGAFFNRSDASNTISIELREEKLSSLARSIEELSKQSVNIGKMIDAILVAAAPHAVPMKLLEQLKDGGRLVAPIGPEGQQELLRLTKRGDQYMRERLGFVSFVPLVGGVS